MSNLKSESLAEFGTIHTQYVRLSPLIPRGHCMRLAKGQQPLHYCRFHTDFPFYRISCGLVMQ